ncbi:MAG: stage sporulation protein [Blastocatellia bacterium]|nr:stage sporulation protein [Blastocatellia bacterium]
MSSRTERLEWNPYLQLLVLASVCCAILFATVSQRSIRWSSSSSSASAPTSEDLVDTALQKAATSALGEREGAIIVIDPQSGRIRAVVNPEMAFGEAFAPGSTIKPFTALAALRAGLIDKRSRTVCHEHYEHESFATVCSHPTELPALDTTDALAYSCNYYFGKLGERMSEEQFRPTLASFGFGRKTGTNIANESAGKLGAGKWSSQAALGEGQYAQVTPAQLLAAYVALANGGRLLAPLDQKAENFQPRVNATLQINADQRELILAGMRGAVLFGTAKRSGLASLPFSVFGKTGTSTPYKGFRTQGWFVGLAANNEDPTVSGDGVRLAVLIFLKRSHGADAAALSLPIFEEFGKTLSAGTNRTGDGEKGSKDFAPGSMTASTRSTAPSSHLAVSLTPSLPDGARVRVHLVREDRTVEIPFEDYVLGVVATEGSVEDEPEALRALAIAARTYAIKNSGRHQHEGFDFCSTTHCQRFQLADNDSPRMIDAVRATAGEVLLDNRGQVVESYFGASCGGATANLGTLWGGKTPSHLRGVPDEYCAMMPHESWTDVITRGELLAALHSDSRTDVGSRLDDVIVSRRDATARAELITLSGDQRKIVRGWDFKIIVGRTLGWNKLKSSRFSVRRVGNDFVFRGSGFGHGLGLCQEGAHVMAQRGAGYRQILGKYFPGTTVAQNPRRGGTPWPPPSSQSSQGWHADVLLTPGGAPAPPAPAPAPAPAPGSPRITLSSEHFRVTFSAGNDRRDIELLLGTMESVREDLLRRSAAGPVAFPLIQVNINETTGDFVGRTGQPWWAAAATRGNRIEMQPLVVLKRRGTVRPILRHELAHAFMDAISHGRAPRWLAEGFALHLAGEGKMISRYAGKERLGLTELESRLAQPGSADAMRQAYAAAYREVSGIVRSEGEAKVWLQLASY